MILGVKLHRKVFSKEHYIEVIYVLLREKEDVYNKDIVNYTKLSKPSVSVAINNLIDEGYVYRESMSIKLTEKGEKIGKELYNKHFYFYNLFLELGVEPKQANEEACSVEHVISNETFKKIKAFIEESSKK